MEKNVENPISRSRFLKLNTNKMSSILSLKIYSGNSAYKLRKISAQNKLSKKSVQQLKLDLPVNNINKLYSGTTSTWVMRFLLKFLLYRSNSKLLELSCEFAGTLYINKCPSLVPINKLFSANENETCHICCNNCNFMKCIILRSCVAP